MFELFTVYLNPLRKVDPEKPNSPVDNPKFQGFAEQIQHNFCVSLELNASEVTDLTDLPLKTVGRFHYSFFFLLFLPLGEYLFS